MIDDLREYLTCTTGAGINVVGSATVPGGGGIYDNQRLPEDL